MIVKLEDGYYINLPVITEQSARKLNRTRMIARCLSRFSQRHKRELNFKINSH